ncbi:MAG TPA: PAS domain S-box protein, partial [Gemmataceae bacterium]|nr:PAS domain S-box protein [Gemmataceae bacterium]
MGDHASDGPNIPSSPDDALRWTEERLRLALDAGRTGVWEWDIVTGRITWSDRVHEFYGMRPGEFDGTLETFARHLHPDDAARAREAIRASVEDGAPYRIEYRIVQTGGDVRWINSAGHVVRAADGTPLRMLGATSDVTDRKAADETRRASEERFRGLMEQAPFSVQIFAPDGRTLGVNRAWEELWGLRLDQLADYNLLADPQLEAKGIAPLLRRAAAGEAVQIPAIRYDVDESLPGRSAHPDPHRWVSAVAYPLKDPAGRVREVVLVHQDITAQVRAQEAVRRNEAWLRTVTDSLPVLVSYVDRGLRYRFANRAYEDWFGVPAAAVLGKTLVEVLGESNFRLRREAIEGALAGEPVRFEAPTHHRTLGERVTEMTYTPHREGGAVVGFFVHAQDVTERVWAEAAVRASEAEFRATFERAGVGKGQADPATGRLTRVNPKLCELLGYTADELVGMTIREITHPDDRAAGDERFRGLVAGEVDQYAVEKRYLRKGGEAVWVRVTATMVRAPDGRPVRASAIIEDVTARIQAEEALREADRRKDAFIAMLAHELRNPLGPIGNAVQVLGASRDAATVERVREMIGRQVGHLSRIVSDLLDVSRVTRGKIDLHTERLDLARLAAVVAGDEAAAFEAAGVRLAVAVPDTPVWVSGDRTRLTQVVSNLLANAVKFTDRGGAVRVEV